MTAQEPEAPQLIEPVLIELDEDDEDITPGLCVPFGG